MKQIRKNRTISLLILALCAGLIAGCGSDAVQPEEADTNAPTPAMSETTRPEPTAEPLPAVDDNALVYETEKNVFQDKYNEYAVYSLSRNMETCTLGNRMYSFEKSIGEADRAARIRETEELFRRLGIDPELRICLYTTLKDTYIEDGSVYGRFGSLTGADYTAAVLLGVYGEFGNYGMATGYARLLAGETPAEIDELSADWAYYDLNYLCFQPAFSSEEDAALCEKLALAFAADYVEKHGDAAYLELLRRSGEPEEAEAARAALLDFYAAKGVEPVLSPILYAMGGANYDYLAKCEYACNYLDKSWSDPDMIEAGLYTETYLHEKYEDVRDCFETLGKEMRQCQEFFRLYPYRNELKVFIVGSKAPFAGGYYRDDYHDVFLNALSVYTHEYIHAITANCLKKPIVSWQAEGLSYYYQAKFSRYFCEITNYYHDISVFPTQKWLLRHYEEYGRPSDTEKDWADECDRKAFFYDAYFLGERAKNLYDASASFLNYLFRQFGEREVLDYLLDNHDLTTLTDMTFDELTAAWKEENDARFEKHPKWKD